MFKVTNTPNDLCFFIARVCQRRNHVIVDLSNSRTVATKMLCALFVRFENCLIRFQVMNLHPRKKRRTEIKADLRIIVDDVFYNTLFIQYPGRSIWSVALGGYPFIPIVIWMG